MTYLDLPFSLPEQVLNQRFIIATFQFSHVSSGSVLERSARFAVGQSVGTWVSIPGVTRELVEEHQARVVGVFGPCDEAESTFIVRIAFPWDNFGNSTAQMLTALVGNDVSTSVPCKLLDIEMPNEVLSDFRGPHQGITGVRKLTGIYDRPIVLNMIKPCTGYSPEVGAGFFFDAASGGVDIIKDDELLGNTGFSGVENRVTAYLGAAKRAYELTGYYTHYCVNISDRIDRVRDNAQAAIASGAKILMVNFVTVGVDGLWSLTDEFGEEVAFLGHYAGLSMFTANKEVGIGSKLLNGKLARLAGADMAVVPYSATEKTAYLETAQQLQLPFGNIAPSMPAIGGGITPRIAAQLGKELGNDIIFAVGGAIQGHPLGTTAGARTMRIVAEAIGKGQELADIASTNEELAIALQAW